jgi:hypothetical protein
MARERSAQAAARRSTAGGPAAGLPQASFAAIEAEVDAQLSQLRAQLLADLALASAATEVTGPVALVCPGCGGTLQDEGPRERTVVTVGHAPVTLRRDYATCTECGYRFSPSGR